MSDEPLIFEHTSDEPEQNGFPLDTADLPLDSVDSSDSEEDVNQLLDLISKDYTNEDEDDEEEPLVYDDDSSDLICKSRKCLCSAKMMMSLCLKMTKRKRVTKPIPH